jgi:hypothetical protein
MSTHTKTLLSSIKGRLAGFFLWRSARQLLAITIAILMLAGCKPALKPQPGELAFQQAQQALQQGLSFKANSLFQQSASLGYLPAVAAILEMQKPQDSSVELRAWLRTLPASMQPRLTPFYQQLGLQLPVITQTSTISDSVSHCAIRIQPIVSTKLEQQQWSKLYNAWLKDTFLASLPVCFLKEQRVDAASLTCSDDPNSRLRCHLPALQTLVKQGHFSQLLILSGRGAANFDNGVLHLPTYADLKLLQHEFSHVLGFLDEYPLPKSAVVAECQPGRITANILFTEADLAKYLAHWQLSKQQVTLKPVATCAHGNKRAFRVVHEDSHLQHYEFTIPPLYQLLMQKQLQRAHEIMPVQYYFAYLARQDADWRLWQEQMEKAASFGYPAAQAALAEWQQRQSTNSTAR